MSDYSIVPRTASGLDPIVYNNDGRTRRPELSDEQWAVVHWPGVETDWDNWPHPGASTSDLVYRLDEVAAQNGKRNEYNYVIGRQPEDRFRVHEYAGHYAGAHSYGENTESVGALLVYDRNQPLLPQQVEAFRWLMWESRRTGLLAPDHLILPHQDMSGASTGCPGPDGMDAMPALRVPWVPPTPGEDEAMTELLEKLLAVAESSFTQLRYIRGGPKPGGGTYGTSGVAQIRQDTKAINSNTAGTKALLDLLLEQVGEINVRLDEFADHLGAPEG